MPARTGTPALQRRKTTRADRTRGIVGLLKNHKVLKLIILAVTLAAMLIVMSSCSALLGSTEQDGTTGDGAAASATTRPGAAASDAVNGTEAGDEDTGGGALATLLGSRSSALQIVAIITILSIAPSILLMVTSFTRIVIVLSFTRNALGLQQMPPNQVLIALAVFLTFFVMSPVFGAIQTDALEPYLADEITLDEAVTAAEAPLREFMLMQTYPEDLDMFMDFSNISVTQTLDEVPITTIIPAFITSELRRGFMIGFFIYIPFIVIDMVVASTLMAMGMMMLPPITISLPFKVLLFVLVDGWTLTISTLLSTFNVIT